MHLQVYDLDQNLKQKTIDLIAVGKQKDYDINRFEIQAGLIYVLDGKDYVHIAFYRRGDKRRNHEDYLLNLDTEELIAVPNQDILNSEEYLELNDAIYISNLAPVVYKKYGVNINWSSPQRLFEPVLDPDEKSVLKLDDSNFKKTYPKVAQMLESSKTTLVLARQEVVSDETYFNTLLEWFAPVGEEKLDLVIKKYGTDVRIPIKSYSDFIEYRKIYPKKESTDVTKED